VVEHLSSKHEALNLSPSTAEKKKKNQVGPRWNRNVDREVRVL
jgi:hypothetical protein